MKKYGVVSIDPPDRINIGNNEVKNIYFICHIFIQPTFKDKT